MAAQTTPKFRKGSRVRLTLEEAHSLWIVCEVRWQEHTGWEYDIEQGPKNRQRVPEAGLKGSFD